MKAIKFLLLLALVCGSLLLISCDPDNDDDFNPEDIFNLEDEDFDWIISFFGGEETGKMAYYMVVISYNGNVTELSQDDVAMLKMNDVEYPLEAEMPGFYHIPNVQMEPGVNHTWKFYYNNELKGNVSMSMPYDCLGVYPGTFNPAQAATINWSMDHSNPYQLAGASSSRWVGATEDYYDEYIKSIPVSDRSFTVPANSVDSFGAGTSYYLFVDQVNYKFDNRTAFVAWRGSEHSYNETLLASPQKQIRHSRNILRALTQHN